ncbi:uncharacterized protein LOC136062078 [Quercus suber]|uniref:uncharacterized protein LOC136062078 n=1 Tax=Quercus suber TaxID=58331 RepID=UPI0032DFFEED
MRGELNGLKTLILKDNPFAYYVHCFAHQFQLTLVAVAKNNIQIATFLNLVAKVFNIVGASCKRHDILHKKRSAKVIEELKNNEISTGRGWNQEMSLKRPGDTRWSSHFGALVNLIHTFSSVIDVIETIIEDGLDFDQRPKANILIGLLQTFEFVFDLHLMKGVLEISNELSQELNSCFENSELLLCVACLNPNNLFLAFNKEKLIRLAQFYPSDFPIVQVSFLDNQLETYIHDMWSIEEFLALKGIGQLAEKM